MNIDLTPETERVLDEELSKGRFRSIDDLIRASVQALREQALLHQIDQQQHAGTPIAAQERAREFVEWATNHPVTPPLSDEAVSRASLNPDRW